MRRAFKWWAKQKPPVQAVFVCPAIVLALIVVGLVGYAIDPGTSSAAPSSSSSSSSYDPPPRATDPDYSEAEDSDDDGAADNLATIELGYRPDDSDSTKQEIAGQLDLLGSQCTANSATQLSDFTANVIVIVKEQAGFDLTPTQILEDAVTASDAWGSSECSGLFASLALLYKDGMN